LDGVTARSNSSWLKKSVSLVGGRFVAQPDSTASTNKRIFRISTMWSTPGNSRKWTLSAKP
jgi:hypothetical protein